MQHSPTIGELTKALSKARKEFKSIKKENSNPFFKSKYADLATIIQATAPALSENSLAVMQSPGAMIEGIIIVTTLLSHESGEWISDVISLPVSKADAQGAGSAITYARRYAYQALLNVAADDDDDGNAAVSNRDWEKSTDKNEKAGRTINKTQQAAFWSAAKQGGKDLDAVKKYLGVLGISKTDEILKTDLDMAMKWALKPLPEEESQEPLVDEFGDVVKP